MVPVFKLHVSASLRSLKASIDSKGSFEFLITQIYECCAQQLAQTHFLSSFSSFKALKFLDPNFHLEKVWANVPPMSLGGCGRERHAASLLTGGGELHAR